MSNIYNLSKTESNLNNLITLQAISEYPPHIQNRIKNNKFADNINSAILRQLMIDEIEKVKL